MKINTPEAARNKTIGKRGESIHNNINQEQDWAIFVDVAQNVNKSAIHLQNKKSYDSPTVGKRNNNNNRLPNVSGAEQNILHGSQEAYDLN